MAVRQVERAREAEMRKVRRQVANDTGRQIDLHGVAERLGEKEHALAVQRKLGPFSEPGQLPDVRRQILVWRDHAGGRDGRGLLARRCGCTDSGEHHARDYAKGHEDRIRSRMMSHGRKCSASERACHLAKRGGALLFHDAREKAPGSAAHDRLPGATGRSNEQDPRWAADRRVPLREAQTVPVSQHLECGDGVASLVAHIHVPSGGIDVEAAWIIATRPLLVDEFRTSASFDAENRDGVVEAVGGIDERPIRRDHDFRREIRADESLRKRGYLIDQDQ